MDHATQFRDLMMMYNKITENCFNSCVYDMNQRKLNNSEAMCTHNCFWKHLQSNNRLMIIFSELQAKKQENSLREQEIQMQKIVASQNQSEPSPT
ncbi:hypothetical protein EB796_020266 [Bugula neritina]|uniref:Mitochondrial import inner membrane translocase subunit n=1 Tax=Bugula neritina TaxID=10212 RepID=A0A7J7J5M3_BUGNE|nr:hypothetical protein EB796_020266 [Bugula neritina]